MINLFITLIPADASDNRIIIGAPEKVSRARLMISAGEHMRSFFGKEAGLKGLLALAGLALAYGVLHALGPGHQKALITGYLFSEGGGIGTVFKASSIAALSHAVSVVGLFGGLIVLSGGLKILDAESARTVITKISALILTALSLRMLYVRVKAFNARLKEHDHSQEESCSCGCTEERKRPGSSISVILAGSLVPCPGAAFFLLYGFSAGNPLAGILSVLSISLGMWLTLTALGILVMFLRKESLVSADKKKGRTTLYLRSFFEIGGSLMVLLFAVSLIL